MRASHLLFLLACFWFALEARGQQMPDSTNGSYKEFYSNGRIKMKGHFKEGLRKGSFYYYAEDGKLLKQEIYHKGKLNWTYFFNAQGRVIRKIDKNGKETKKPDCGCT